MSTFSLSELKRLTPPFATKADEADAERYWSQSPSEEREKANRQLLSEFYRERGVDIDQPMEKTIRLRSFAEKNREHEEWHRDFERFLRDR